MSILTMSLLSLILALEDHTVRQISSPSLRAFVYGGCSGFRFLRVHEVCYQISRYRSFRNYVDSNRLRKATKRDFGDSRDARTEFARSCSRDIVPME